MASTDSAREPPEIWILPDSSSSSRKMIQTFCSKVICFNPIQKPLDSWSKPRWLTKTTRSFFKFFSANPPPQVVQSSAEDSSVIGALHSRNDLFFTFLWRAHGRKSRPFPTRAEENVNQPTKKLTLQELPRPTRSESAGISHWSVEPGQKTIKAHKKGKVEFKNLQP